MAEHGYAIISELDGSKTDWTILLRVDRLYLATKPGVPKQDANLSCIAIDQTGEAIHMEIDRDQVSTYLDVLKEGNLYVISHFHVVPTTSFEPLNRDFKIEFIIGTTVVDYKGESIDIPFHCFQFCAFERLGERDSMDEHTIDLVGLLDTIRDTETIQTKFGPTDRTNIVLLDEQESQANVTLWGTASDEFNQLQLRGRQDTIVLIVTTLMVRQIGGVFRASSTSGTKLYANLDHHDVDAYLERHKGVDRPPKLLPAETFRKSSLGPNVEPEQLTVRQLLDLPRNNLRDRKFTSKVIIQTFDLRNFWYYYGCRFCSKTIPVRGKATNCFGCGARDVEAVPCYKLEAFVMDGTGAALFIFFPNAAEQLVGLPLSSLLLQEPSTRRQLPSRIRSLIDSRWELQVVVNFKSYAATTLVFNVSRVIKQLSRATLALPAPPPLEELPKSLVFDIKGKRPMTTEELEDERKKAKRGMPIPRQINLPPSTAALALPAPPSPKEIPNLPSLSEPTLREKIAIRLQELRESVQTLEECKKVLLEEFENGSENDDEGQTVQQIIDGEAKDLEHKQLTSMKFWTDVIEGGCKDDAKVVITPSQVKKEIEDSNETNQRSKSAGYKK